MKLTKEDIEIAKGALQSTRIVHDLAKAYLHKSTDAEATEIERNAAVMIEGALKLREEEQLNKLAAMLDVEFTGPLERYYGVVAKALEEQWLKT